MDLDDLEIPEDLTSQIVADACQAFIDLSECDDIASMEDAADALGAAFGALIVAGHDPDELLKSLGIIE